MRRRTSSGTKPSASLPGLRTLGIALGPVPEEVREANRVRRAIGGAMLSVLGGDGETMTFQERVDRALSDPLGDDLETREWFLTVTLSRVIDVPDDQITPGHGGGHGGSA